MAPAQNRRWAMRRGAVVRGAVVRGAFVRAMTMWVLVVLGAGEVRAAHGARRGPRHKVDVNAASARELAGVPGLGPKLAAAVIESREREGPFESATQLTRV